MINVTTKIHDKFSIEFKVGFAGSEHDSVNDFTVNSWIFVPYSLDINPSTYGKEQFYRDVKSNVRLITPSYRLSEMVEGDATPLHNVQELLQKYIDQPTEANLSEYNFHVRLFAAIFKSALRNEVADLISLQDQPHLTESCRQLESHITNVLERYRAVRPVDAPHPEVDVYAYADEFMSHLTDVQINKLLMHLRQFASDETGTAQSLLTDLLMRERAYKTQQGYSHLEEGDDNGNRELVLRHSLLKKNIESALYLKAAAEPDSQAAQQLFFGIAAGIAMFIYVLITLPLQAYLGNYPLLILVILVVSYILKDRIKEFFRGRFAYRLKDKYFDSKTLIRFKGTEMGWMKEGVDYIDESKTPEKVLALRHRSGMETDNSLLGEQTLLYRKQVHIDNEQLRRHNRYGFSGIHDIMRLHIQHFTLKMDDPDLALGTVNRHGEPATIHTQRIYPLYIVLQFTHNEQTEYRSFRITSTRNGIVECIETTS